MRLLFVVNDPAFFVSHRLPIAIAAQRIGWDVHVATSDGPAVSEVRSRGMVHHVLPIARSTKKPVTELRSLWAMIVLFRHVKPDLVHLVTIKPVLYGGIAAQVARVPGVVAAVSGLGFVFIASGLKAKLLRFTVVALYRAALRKKNLRVIFQNPDDRATFLAVGIVSAGKSITVRGSGVDLSIYRAEPEPEGTPVITMASRLLRDKGVCEFVEAARLLARDGIKVRFWLVGDRDPGNPTSVSEETIDAWRTEGRIELLGSRADMPKIFACSNVVALPSYREGLPKVLLEAAACGRAVVTANAPGCRDAVEPGITGLIVPPRDAEALAAAIKVLIEDKQLRHRMGRAGRQFAEREFAIEAIVETHLAIYRDLVSHC